jgi:polyisoprenoid-binding protein YceI
MKKILTSILVIGLIVSQAAMAQVIWKPTKASVSFSIRHAGLTVDGSFRGFLGEFAFDPKAPEKSSLSASVDANTIDTGITLRNNHLKKTEYFDVATYPRISLKSVKMTRLSGNNFEGTFALTIKGTTRTVVIPFTFVEEGTTGSFAGQFGLNRLDYKVGGKNFLMSNDVTLKINVQTMRQVQ